MCKSPHLASRNHFVFVLSSLSGLIFQLGIMVFCTFKTKFKSGIVINKETHKILKMILFVVIANIALIFLILQSRKRVADPLQRQIPTLNQFPAPAKGRLHFNSSCSIFSKSTPLIFSNEFFISRSFSGFSLARLNC